MNDTNKNELPAHLLPRQKRGHNIAGTNDTKHTPKAFVTFKRGGIQFIAIPHNDGIAVLDDGGNNYGSYNSQESFEDFAGRNGGFESLKLGEANLAIHHKAKAN